MSRAHFLILSSNASILDVFRRVSQSIFVGGILRNDEICSTSSFYTRPDCRACDIRHVWTCSDVFRHACRCSSLPENQPAGETACRRSSLPEKQPAGVAACRCITILHTTLLSAHRAVIFAIAQLSCYVYDSKRCESVDHRCCRRSSNRCPPLMACLFLAGTTT